MGAQIPGVVISDTVRAVFSDPAYHRTALLQRLGAWILKVFRSILARLGPGHLPAPVFWIVVVAALIAVSLIVIRAIWLLAGERRPRRAAGTRQAPGSDESDPWSAAARLAAGGEYTAAAHALYAGLLRLLAGRGVVELHESKTTGDYRRDLFRRRSGLAGRFGDFTRQYELAIYGLGSCDRERYATLEQLAGPFRDSGV